MKHTTKLFLIIVLIFSSGCLQQKSPRPDYVGDLGGVAVDLPRHIAEMVEYNEDSSWGEKRVGKKPERNYDSKISSLGFEIRYTDATLLARDDVQLRQQFNKQSELSNNPWVSVGIMSGERYNKAGAVDRIANGEINPGPKVNPWRQYKKLPDNQFGMEVYASPGIDPETNKPYREHDYAEDVFIKRDNSGQIITYIKCSNVKVKRPPCNHFFDLEPQMQLYVYAQYSRHNLADWQQIQQAVSKAILGFKVTE